MRTKIERILSDILSEKYDAKIRIRFKDLKEYDYNGNEYSSGNFGKEQILDR